MGHLQVLRTTTIVLAAALLALYQYSLVSRALRTIILPTVSWEPTTSDLSSEEQQKLSLEDIQLGTFLGHGKFTDAFDTDIPQSFKTAGKEYVIKFTGDYRNPKYFFHGKISSQLMNTLSPHPSIPETLLFLESAPNPFRNNIFHINGTISKTTTKRLNRSQNMSITVTEKVTATHEHINEDDILDIPASKVRCFWRNLFELLGYLHSKNVMMIDTKLWNILLQNGTIVMFDWNNGKVFHDGLSVEEYGWHVHEYDVYSFGKRMREFLDHQEELAAAGSSNVISPLDIRLLRHMVRSMRLKSPSTTKLLDHEYFDQDRNVSCSLTW